jgi:hypothetical protein
MNNLELSRVPQNDRLNCRRNKCQIFKKSLLFSLFSGNLATEAGATLFDRLDRSNRPALPGVLDRISQSEVVRI